MKIFLKFLTYGLLTYLVNGSCKVKSPDQLKTYAINLDLPPSERFLQPSTDFQDGIRTLVNYQKSLIDPAAIPIIETIASDIDRYLPFPFNEELKGISNATGLNLGDVVVANLIYDITAFCTSIVAQDKSNRIIHGRNLDYGFYNYMKNITFIARFERSGQLVFTSVHTAGFVGILSGHKYNKFTLTIDERDQGAWWINFLFAILDRKATPLAFLTRNVMENGTDFNNALEILSTNDLIAPAYFIVGGVKPYEGAVITRNQYDIIDVWRLNASSPGIESWYLLETNYDHWLPPPSSDDRRDPGMKAMNETGKQNINYDTLLSVLSIPPVCNNSTIYSVYMSAIEDDSTIRVLMRYD